MPKTTLSAHEKIATRVIYEWLGFQIRHTDIPGLQVSIRHKRNLIFNEAFGVTNIKTNKKHTPNHLGHIASHSKMFTMALILKLSEQKKLSLSDPIIQYIPALQKHTDPRFKKITIKDVLMNRSGIFRDGTDARFWEMEKPFLTKDQIIKEVLNSNLSYAPNKHTKYSNIGFALLGMVAEYVGEKPYDKLIKEIILKHLPKSTFLTDYSTKNKNPFADGHSKALYKNTRKIFKHEPTHAMAPAGGFCSNTQSITLFLYTLLYTNKILSKKNRDLLIKTKNAVLNLDNRFYGIGLAFENLGGQMYVGHGGAYPGFMSNTLSPIGSHYIFGNILNATESVGLDITRSMFETIQKIKDTFSTAELKNAIISAPIMNKWGGYIYVIGKNKALAFGLGSWHLTANTVTFKRQGNQLQSTEINGYSYPSEPIDIQFKNNNIYSVKMGGYTSYTEKVYLRRSQKVFIS